MDVYATICGLLEADVCPVYAPSDAQQDARALADALGLPPIAIASAGSSSPAWYDACTASQLLGVTDKDWARLVATVRHVGWTSRSKKPRLCGRGVRRAVLAAHGGSPAAWLASRAGCSEWFARLLLPMPSADESVMSAVRSAWAIVSDYASASHDDHTEDRQEELRAMLRARWSRRIVQSRDGGLSCPDAMDLEDDCAATCGTPQQLRALLFRRLGAASDAAGAPAAHLGTELGAASDAAGARAAHLGTELDGLFEAARDITATSPEKRLKILRNARRLGSSAAKSATTPELARRCAKFVLCGGSDADLAEIEHDLTRARRAHLYARAEAASMDLSDYPDDNSEFLEDEVRNREEEIEITNEFEEYGLRVDEFDEFFARSRHGVAAPSRVTHLESGLQTADLEPLYYAAGEVERDGSLHECTWVDPEDVLAQFERYVGLRAALVAAGLQLRDDSRVCAEYVLYGTYSGAPHAETTDALACAVAMMREMAFLFAETSYENFMRHLRDSDAAKALAVREYLNKGGDKDGRLVALPPRLRSVATDAPLTAEEQSLTTWSPWVDSDEYEDRSSDCDSIYDSEYEDDYETGRM